MKSIREEVATALDEVLKEAVGESDEFKRRFRQLIENTSNGNVVDTDVVEVIRLASVPDELDE
ncbi:MAG: hypothetical protein Q8M93_04750 [Polaromonas sp.]|uniref:hypothetical protein n=1 Tax=Polaromonas sp. TaxID=1869339 RepID=UPI002732088E|nr:hypothetical protein [Polaromonas sp.]MDP2450749.1 hypothetical protein [Polaromonas sp.]MDP3246254.1 hypothetical protein [Polaromonas sp.]MDP3754900.1 hypothetical protein [Polaromonas sp.]